jgi:hypothetical protein
LYWTHPHVLNFRYYYIHKWTDNGASTSFIIEDFSQYGYIDTDVVPGTTYHYEIWAIGEIGNFSNRVTLYYEQ